MQRQNVHLELELVLHRVAAKVANVWIVVILVVLLVRLQVLLGAEQLFAIVVVAREIRMVHVIHAIVRHYREFRGDGLVAQMAGVGAVMVLDMFLQAGAILEDPLAGATTREQGTRVFAIVLAALHVTAQQVALVEGLVALFAVVQRLLVDIGGLQAGQIARVALHVQLVAVNLGDVRRQMIPRRARFHAVLARDVRVSLVHPIYVLPEVRGSAVALVAQITGKQAVNGAPMVAELVEIREFHVHAHLTAEIHLRRAVVLDFRLDNGLAHAVVREALDVQSVNLPVTRHFRLVRVRSPANVAAKVAVGQWPVIGAHVRAQLYHVGEDFEAYPAYQRHRVRVHAHHVLPVVHSAAPQFAANLAGVWRGTLDQVMLRVLVAQRFGGKYLCAILSLALCREKETTECWL